MQMCIGAYASVVGRREAAPREGPVGGGPAAVPGGGQANRLGSGARHAYICTGAIKRICAARPHPGLEAAGPHGHGPRANPAYDAPSDRWLWAKSDSLIN